MWRLLRNRVWTGHRLEMINRDSISSRTHLQYKVLGRTSTSVELRQRLVRGILVEKHKVCRGQSSRDPS